MNTPQEKYYTANEVIRILRDEHGIPGQMGRVIIQMVISFGQMTIGDKNSASWRGYSPANSVTITHDESIPFFESQKAFTITPLHASGE